jgi:hypothetical protein
VRVNDVVIPRDAIAREVQYHPSRTPAAFMAGGGTGAGGVRSRSIVNGAREGEWLTLIGQMSRAENPGHLRHALSNACLPSQRA